VSKILKEILIEGHKKSSPSTMNAPPRSRFTVGRKKSSANAVRGEFGGSLDSQLMGWKCTACGCSWDVFAAVVGEGQDGDCNERKQKVSFKDGFCDMSLFPSKKSGAKDFLGVNPPCDNEFKLLRDMLMNYPSSDCECSSHPSSPSTSSIP